VSGSETCHTGLTIFSGQRVPSVGYGYPEMYNRIFGADYEPDEYIKHDAEFARKHRYYMEARLITVNDQYAFDENQREVTIEEYTDIIGRQFRQPKEGLGFDNSPTAHMWRTLINPDRPL
jgi:alpha-glucosidase (family GH31 glycosyl hydrolase)